MGFTCHFITLISNHPTNSIPNKDRLKMKSIIFKVFLWIDTTFNHGGKVVNYSFCYFCSVTLAEWSNQFIDHNSLENEWRI
jgi:hypothetical protein